MENRRLENKYVTFSIYLDIQNCHLLIRHILSAGSVAEKYGTRFRLINLNYYGGFNIRLIYYLHHYSDPQQLAQEINLVLCAFFQQHSLKPGYPVPRAELFMDQFINTIQFGQFNPERFLTLSNLPLETGMSEIIMETLAAESFDLDVLFTFAFYLHLILIRTFLETYGIPLHENFLSAYQAGAANQIAPGKRTHDKYCSVKSQFDEIKSDVFSKQADVQIPWIVKAADLFNTEYAARRYCVKSGDSFTKLWQLPRLINRHLGFDQEKTEILNYFIRNTLCKTSA